MIAVRATSFWVIFDTCTEPDYYQDVHNVLALPRGATVRYEYREQWLSPAAVQAASDPPSAPTAILLVYAQWKDYTKGGTSPASPPPAEEMAWLPIRLADMQLIPPREGDNFFFDFKLGDYPRLDSDCLRDILSPLMAAQEVPLHKWVSISHDVEALKSLRSQLDSDNWQKIVDSLATPPMQFQGDTFWRVKGPYRPSSRPIQPTYREERQYVSGTEQSRQVTSLYNLDENEGCSIEVISHTPPTPREALSGSNVPQRRLQVQVDQGGPLSLEGDTTLDLRHYTAQSIRVRATRSEELDERATIVRLNSAAQPTQWPTGPDVRLRFSVKKGTSRMFAATCFGLCGALFVFIAGNIWDQNNAASVAVGLAGTALIFIASVLLRGKLPMTL